MNDLRALLDEIVGRESIPAISLCVHVDGGEVFHHTTGAAVLPDVLAPGHPGEAASPDLAFDLASVTKVLAGTPVVAALFREGVLTPTQSVATYLPDVDPRIRVIDLLTHGGGYPAHIKFYETLPELPWGAAATRRAVLDAARRTPLVHPPGTVHCYSDIGFLVLLDLCETVSGTPFQVLHHTHVGEAHADLRWGWPEAAATELCPVRGRLIRGTVHDPNCAFLGGISTHAGLFGTARAVAAVMATLTDAARDGDPVLRMLMNMSGPGHHRGGFDAISEGYSSTGQFFPRDTVGHLGYTGCSVWSSPSTRTTVALLTNRIHPMDDKTVIRSVRPRVHDAVARELGWDKARP